MNLHEACYQGKIALVRSLLDGGAEPNGLADLLTREWVSCAGPRPHPLNCVAIAWSITKAHVEIAQLLIDHGASVDETVIRDHEAEMVFSAEDMLLRQVFRAALAKTDPSLAERMDANDAEFALLRRKPARPDST